MKQKFSRERVINKIDENISFLEKEYKFSYNNGWNQVNGKGEEINRKYGEFAALWQIKEEIENL